MANAFALLRLLPMSDRDKDAEILALRHQLAVLQRQLGANRVRVAPSDRALLAALLHHLPRRGPGTCTSPCARYCGGTVIWSPGDKLRDPGPNAWAAAYRALDPYIGSLIGAQ